MLAAAIEARAPASDETEAQQRADLHVFACVRALTRGDCGIRRYGFGNATARQSPIHAITAMLSPEEATKHRAFRFSENSKFFRFAWRGILAFAGG
jgi:hypothetical protein